MAHDSAAATAKHDDEARAIARKGREFAIKHFNNHATGCYWLEALRQYRAQLAFDTRLNVTKALKDDIYCDVLDLQLRRIILSNEYEETKLQAAIQTEKSQQATFDGETVVVEAETEKETTDRDRESGRGADGSEGPFVF